MLGSQLGKVRQELANFCRSHLALELSDRTVELKVVTSGTISKHTPVGSTMSSVTFAAGNHKRQEELGCEREQCGNQQDLMIRNSLAKASSLADFHSNTFVVHGRRACIMRRSQCHLQYCSRIVPTQHPSVSDNADSKGQFNAQRGSISTCCISKHPPFEECLGMEVVWARIACQVGAGMGRQLTLNTSL